MQRRDLGWRDRPRDFGVPYNLANHPVVGVSWYEAMAFCRWLEYQLAASDELARLQTEVSDLNQQPVPALSLTLPSEAEWEKAARGTDGRRYPWGNEIDPNRGNYVDTQIGTTNAVGCFPGGVSPYGVEEMSGNVWDWTRSLWGEDLYNPSFKYPYDATDGREDLEVRTDIRRVLRGGAFFDNVRSVRCALRNRYNPNFRDLGLGFRVSVSPIL